MEKAKLIGINRLRMFSDGHGITTLVGFHGCPLRCKYCLNPQCFRNEVLIEKTAEEIMKDLRKDELYFIATKGGVTFGGGEPLLHAEFIRDVLELGAKQWNVTIETSLNIPIEKLELLLPYVNEYIVDIKDMNPAIYQSYTGKDNTFVISNLRWLVKQGKAKNIICKIPFIPSYNDNTDRKRSAEKLKELGIERSHFFDYCTTIKK